MCVVSALQKSTQHNAILLKSCLIRDPCITVKKGQFLTVYTYETYCLGVPSSMDAFPI